MKKYYNLAPQNETELASLFSFFDTCGMSPEKNRKFRNEILDGFENIINISNIDTAYEIEYYKNTTQKNTYDNNIKIISVSDNHWNTIKDVCNTVFNCETPKPGKALFNLEMLPSDEFVWFPQVKSQNG